MAIDFNKLPHGQMRCPSCNGSGFSHQTSKGKAKQCRKCKGIGAIYQPGFVNKQRGPGHNIDTSTWSFPSLGATYYPNGK